MIQRNIYLHIIFLDYNLGEVDAVFMGELVMPNVLVQHVVLAAPPLKVRSSVFRAIIL